MECRGLGAEGAAFIRAKDSWRLGLTLGLASLCLASLCSARTSLCSLLCTTFIVQRTSGSGKTRGAGSFRGVQPSSRTVNTGRTGKHRTSCGDDIRPRRSAGIVKPASLTGIVGPASAAAFRGARVACMGRTPRLPPSPLAEEPSPHIAPAPGAPCAGTPLPPTPDAVKPPSLQTNVVVAPSPLPSAPEALTCW